MFIVCWFAALWLESFMGEAVGSRLALMPSTYFPGLLGAGWRRSGASWEVKSEKTDLLVQLISQLDSYSLNQHLIRPDVDITG